MAQPHGTDTRPPIIFSTCGLSKAAFKATPATAIVQILSIEHRILRK